MNTDLNGRLVELAGVALELGKLVGVLDTDEAGVVAASKALVVKSSGESLMVLNLLDGDLRLKDDDVRVRNNVGALASDGERLIRNRSGDDTRKGSGENRDVLEEADHFGRSNEDEGR